MNKHLIVFTLCAVVGGPGTLAQVNAQEQKHEELKAQKESAETKNPPAVKAPGMPCCEMMEKMGEVKDGARMKGDMKTKMEKMKEMKEKMAEKMKSTAGDSAGQKTEAKTDAAKTAEKSSHQH